MELLFFKEAYSLPLNVRQELDAGVITCFFFGFMETEYFNAVESKLCSSDTL
jgi:hypothetical protein